MMKRESKLEITIKQLLLCSSNKLTTNWFRNAFASLVFPSVWLLWRYFRPYILEPNDMSLHWICRSYFYMN